MRKDKILIITIIVLTIIVICLSICSINFKKRYDRSELINNVFEKIENISDSKIYRFRMSFRKSSFYSSGNYSIEIELKDGYEVSVDKNSNSWTKIYNDLLAMEDFINKRIEVSE